jgi:hypothetical protein
MHEVTAAASLLSSLILWCVQFDQVINAQNGQRRLGGKLQDAKPAAVR